MCGTSRHSARETYMKKPMPSVAWAQADQAKKHAKDMDARMQESKNKIVATLREDFEEEKRALDEKMKKKEKALEEAKTAKRQADLTNSWGAQVAGEAQELKNALGVIDHLLKKKFDTCCEQ